ncbi:MAG: HD domain-containing protein [Minisyncoccia bacterium]
MPFHQIAGRIETLVRLAFEKEFDCHLQFVRDIALELQKEYGGETEVIHIAAIAHDFGRIESGDNTDHPERGAQKIIPHLEKLGVSADRVEKIARCIRMHESLSGFTSIEEEIVANADRLSKITAHGAFMLMVKKETYLDRAKWGLKYIEKNYDMLTLPGLRQKYQEPFKSIQDVYSSVIAGR